MGIVEVLDLDVRAEGSPGDCNVTPEQIVTRMVAFEPGPFPVPPDPAYIESKGGVQPSPDKVRARMPGWLADTIIPVPMIEEFKQELKAKGLL